MVNRGHGPAEPQRYATDLGIEIVALAKSRRFRYLSFAFLAIGLAVCTLGYPRLIRCLAYKRVVSNPEAVLALEPQPERFTPTYSGRSLSLDLGYAEIDLPAGWISKAKVVGDEQTTILLLGDNGEQVVILPPFFDTNFSPDGGYKDAVDEAYVRILPLGKIISMSTQDYSVLSARTLAKACNVYNQNGIGFYETKYIRGVAYLGPCDEPGNANLKVWSNPGQVSQGVLIESGESGNKSRLINCILASFRYKITDIPADIPLSKLVRDSLELSEHFDATERLDSP